MSDGVEAEEGFSVQPTTNHMMGYQHLKIDPQSNLMPKELGNYRLSAVSSDTVDPKGVSALPKAFAQEDGDEETFSFAGVMETHSDHGDILQQQERALQGDKETVTDTTIGSEEGFSTASSNLNYKNNCEYHNIAGIERRRLHHATMGGEVVSSPRAHSFVHPENLNQKFHTVIENAETIAHMNDPDMGIANKLVHTPLSGQKPAAKVSKLDDSDPGPRCDLCPPSQRRQKKYSCKYENCDANLCSDCMCICSVCSSAPFCSDHNDCFYHESKVPAPELEATQMNVELLQKEIVAADQRRELERKRATAEHETAVSKARDDTIVHAKREHQFKIEEQRIKHANEMASLRENGISDLGFKDLEAREKDEQIRLIAAEAEDRVKKEFQAHKESMATEFKAAQERAAVEHDFALSQLKSKYEQESEAHIGKQDAVHQMAMQVQSQRYNSEIREIAQSATAAQAIDRTIYESETTSLENRIRRGESQHQRAESAHRQSEESLRGHQNEASILRNQLADSEAQSREKALHNARLQAHALAQSRGEGQLTGEGIVRDEVEKNMLAFKQKHAEEMKAQLELQGSQMLAMFEQRMREAAAAQSASSQTTVELLNAKIARQNADMEHMRVDFAARSASRSASRATGSFGGSYPPDGNRNPAALGDASLGAAGRRATSRGKDDQVPPSFQTLGHMEPSPPPAPFGLGFGGGTNGRPPTAALPSQTVTVTARPVVTKTSAGDPDGGKGPPDDDGFEYAQDEEEGSGSKDNKDDDGKDDDKQDKASKDKKDKKDKKSKKDPDDDDDDGGDSDGGGGGGAGNGGGDPNSDRYHLTNQGHWNQKTPIHVDIPKFPDVPKFSIWCQELLRNIIKSSSDESSIRYYKKAFDNDAKREDFYPLVGLRHGRFHKLSIAIACEILKVMCNIERTPGYPELLTDLAKQIIKEDRRIFQAISDGTRGTLNALEMLQMISHQYSVRRSAGQTYTITNIIQCICPPKPNRNQFITWDEKFHDLLFNQRTPIEEGSEFFDTVMDCYEKGFRKFDEMKVVMDHYDQVDGKKAWIIDGNGMPTDKADSKKNFDYLIKCWDHKKEQSRKDITQNALDKYAGANGGGGGGGGGKGGGKGDGPRKRGRRGNQATPAQFQQAADYYNNSWSNQNTAPAQWDQYAGWRQRPATPSRHSQSPGGGKSRKQCESFLRTGRCDYPGGSKACPTQHNVRDRENWKKQLRARGETPARTPSKGGSATSRGARSRTASPGEYKGKSKGKGKSRGKNTSKGKAGRSMTPGGTRKKGPCYMNHHGKCREPCPDGRSHNKLDDEDHKIKKMWEDKQTREGKPIRHLAPAKGKGKGGGKGKKGKTYRSESGTHRSPNGSKINTFDAGKRGLLSKETIAKIGTMPCRWGFKCKKKDNGCLYKHSQSRSATPCPTAEYDDGSDWQPTEDELHDQFAELDGAYGSIDDDPYGYEWNDEQNWKEFEDWKAWQAQQGF